MLNRVVDQLLRDPLANAEPGRRLEFLVDAVRQLDVAEALCRRSVAVRLSALLRRRFRLVPKEVPLLRDALLRHHPRLAEPVDDLAALVDRLALTDGVR